MCKHGFRSGHRGVATAEYDINFDPEACQKAAITIMGFAQQVCSDTSMSVRLVSVQIFVKLTVWYRPTCVNVCIRSALTFNKRRFTTLSHCLSRRKRIQDRLCTTYDETDYSATILRDSCSVWSQRHKIHVHRLVWRSHTLSQRRGLSINDLCAWNVWNVSLRNKLHCVI